MTEDGQWTTDRRTDDDRHRVITIAHPELCSGDLRKDPKSYILTSSDPQTCPRHHCILLFITFNLICNMTMFVQNGFWTIQSHIALALPPGVTSKFGMCSSSSHPYGYHLWKFRDSSLNDLGAMVWHSKSAGIMIITAKYCSHHFTS